MSSALIPRLFSPILRSSRTISPSVLRPYPRLPRTQQPAARRFAHTIPKPRSPAAAATESTSTSSSPTKKRILLEPHYKLTFTCVPCSGRSTHTISKQGYHKGSVLITCPSCRNRHIISDHLNIFGNRKITVEDLMREKGQLVKRGTLGVDGDVEFWEDGTATEREDDTAGNGFDSTEVKNEVAALSEEEDATRSREARDPSSQSAEPTNRTPTPLSNPGGRPSLDSTQHSHHVPSTRRQYYTGNTHNLDSDGSKPSPFGRPSLSGLPTNPLGSRGAVIEKLDSEDPLRRMLVKKRSAARRISKEEMLEQKKPTVDL
ncbi:DNL zinc finger-domain-containing protein [Hypoxylon rubiginosum]|uniref:DNL zinc finger-domain-containing protein n=1 Tax=Hypoxylon rubiginosum TaxID=110542 RepID=A0ACB9Z7A1_9PEZI|nr:DNL zinc finger-domain-containing protein [Hypoxylon rubiginosum]